MDSVYVLLAFGLGWLVAQAIKVVIAEIKTRGRISFGELIGVMTKSGGMPSGHTASFTAATITIGMLSGFDSTVFALAVCTACIIIYDAINVRYAVGKHGQVINTMMKKHDIEVEGKKALKIVEGHTLAQAIVGFIIGCSVAVVMGLILGKIQLG